LWYARSEAFMQQDLLQTLRWVRTFGDVVFIIGAFSVSWQVVLGIFSGSRMNAIPIDPTKNDKEADEICCGSCDKK
jgi:nitric oxide reductase subunit B